MKRPRSQTGFSLVELLIVTIVMTTMVGIASMLLQPILQQARVTNAYNTTLMAMRIARETAIAQRGAYVVTFTAGAGPNSISVAPAPQWANAPADGAYTATYTLPSDVVFTVNAGVPTSNVAPNCTPDCFGTAGRAVDFDQNVNGAIPNQIYFCPDGSAQDIATGVLCSSNLNNGVVYIARAGDLYSSRAITLWGSTGRLRGWRLLASGTCGTNCWSQQ